MVVNIITGQTRTKMTRYIVRTRIDQALLNVVAQSSKLVNIFQIFSSFSWWSMFKYSSAFTASLNKRDMLRKHPKILFCRSAASSCNTRRINKAKYLPNSSSLVLSNLKNHKPGLSVEGTCTSAFLVVVWSWSKCNKSEHSKKERKEKGEQLSKNDLWTDGQTFASAEESVQELSSQLYQNVWQQLPNVSLFPLSGTLVEIMNHIGLIQLTQACTK